MKNFLLLFAIIISLTTFAQYDNNNLDCNNSSKIIKNNFQSDKSAIIIWEEDFGGGFPSGWSTYTNNTGAGNNGTPASPPNTATCPWKHSTEGSWGYWNSEPKDANNNPLNASTPINSTTSSNGFLISDIDSANHWSGGGATGTTSGSSSGSTYHYLESYFTTSAIDLTGFTNVSLEFEHSFRLNNSVNLTVAVSTDSINWTTYNVQGNATNNQASADPEYLSLNISAVAGNSSTVYVKIGWNARVYFWMIDDIKIVETPDNRLSLVDAENGGWWIGYQTAGGLGMEYTYNPLKQIIANPYTFEGMVTNAGALNQTTRINVDVFDDIGNNVFSTTSADSILTPQDTMTFIGNNTFNPTSVGQYYFQTWASSLDTISDTIISSSIVTDNVYGRDANDDYSEYGLGRSCGGMVIGTYFDIYDTDDVTSLSVFMKDNSVAGADIYAVIYEIDPVTNDPVYLFQSDDYSLTSNDIGGWATISFSSAETLVAGTYMAAIGGYANPVDTSVIGMSQYTYSSTCYIQKNGCLNTGQTFGDWYWTSRVPMIRMNFGSVTPSAIEEKVFGGKISIFPNPTNGIISIDMMDVDPSNYDITITNILGEEILHINENVSGIYNNQVDLASFSKGTYVIQIENKYKVFTDKIIVK